MSELNIYQRINEVRRKVAYIKKDKDVQKYKAVTHDMVIATIRSHLVEHGVMVEPYLQSSEVVDNGRTTKSGIPIVQYRGIYLIRFVNIDKPEDRIELRIEGFADDEGDKAPGKAISYAVKTAQLKLFSLETGESDEGRMEVFNSITPEQVSELKELADEEGMAAMLRWAQVETVEDLPKGKFDLAKSALMKRRAA